MTNEKRITIGEYCGLVKATKRPNVFFDIETAPEEEKVLRELFPGYDESVLPEKPESFDPSSVKTGNLKDPDKIAAKIAQAKHGNLLARKEYPAALKAAKDKQWESFVAKAPLSPIYGRVVAIGYGIIVDSQLNVALHIDCSRERDLLGCFWATVIKLRNGGGKLFQFNGDHFDVPFLTRRSWVKNVPCPYLLTKYNKTEDFCVDVRKVWAMGNYKVEGSLGSIAKAFGTSPKNEETTGAMFWQLLGTDGRKTTKSDREIAERYLTGDITSLFGVANRMGLVKGEC